MVSSNYCGKSDMTMGVKVKTWVKNVKRQYTGMDIYSNRFISLWNCD